MKLCVSVGVVGSGSQAGDVLYMGAAMFDEAYTETLGRWGFWVRPDPLPSLDDVGLSFASAEDYHNAAKAWLPFTTAWQSMDRWVKSHSGRDINTFLKEETWCGWRPDHDLFTLWRASDRYGGGIPTPENIGAIESLQQAVNRHALIAALAGYDDHFGHTLVEFCGLTGVSLRNPADMVQRSVAVGRGFRLINHATKQIYDAGFSRIVGKAS